MITVDEEVLRQALEFIKVTNARSEFWLVPGSNLNKTVNALKAALEQPEQPYAEQARRVEQETHGRMRINPVTGDVSIGTPTEQEPVAWVNHGENRITRATGWDGYGALYTNPPRREWRGLTEDEVEYPHPPAKPPVYATSQNTKAVRDGFVMGGYEKEPGYYSEKQLDEFARAVEAALKEKNYER